MAVEISKIDKKEKKEFMEEVNNAIRLYPGNAAKFQKTIDNWRTEISSLFGLIEYDSELGLCSSGTMANTLAENQDLVEFFKYFLYHFQYPGGHLKPYETLKYIENGLGNWFTCLLYPGMEPTNNLGEQTIRESVIIRKIIGTFRSENGSQYYQYIASLLSTWRVQGKNMFNELDTVIRDNLCLA